jgi:hypothetical protein
MAQIIVVLPDNRNRPGSLRVIDNEGRTIKGPFPVLGLANRKDAIENNNPNRDPLSPFGNTPLGTYKASRALPTGMPGTTLNSVHSYGPNGAIKITPTGGEAAGAPERGLLIHGGALYQDTKTGRKYNLVGLRPTQGCLLLRLKNEHMKQLIDTVQLLEAIGDPVGACSLKKGIEVTVTEVGIDEDPEPDPVPDPINTHGIPELDNPYIPHAYPPGNPPLRGGGGNPARYQPGPQPESQTWGSQSTRPAQPIRPGAIPPESQLHPKPPPKPPPDPKPKPQRPSHRDGTLRNKPPILR